LDGAAISPKLRLKIRSGVSLSRQWGALVVARVSGGMADEILLIGDLQRH
jgi:hypothetical protein